MTYACDCGNAFPLVESKMLHAWKDGENCFHTYLDHYNSDVFMVNVRCGVCGNEEYFEGFELSN